MLKRIYIDNYKCMSNFEYSPARIQLIFGINGSGKTALFEVLERVRDLVVRGYPVKEALDGATCTEWDTRREQSFEIEIEGNGGTYVYKLQVEHHAREEKCRVAREELLFEAGRLYFFDGETVHLYRDDGSQGPSFPQDWSRSGIALIPERNDNQKLCWFRRRMGMVYVIAIDPFRMQDVSESEQGTPARSLENLASWYRHLTQDSPERMSPLFESLGDVIEGFQWIKLIDVGQNNRVMRMGFQRKGTENGERSEFDFVLSQLSQGHRCLIALFTILHCALRKDMTLCIDEPDNFIAIREMQPWVGQLCDRVEELESQCLIISHHPEFLDHPGLRDGMYFERSDAGPVRARSLDWSEYGGLSPSEILARGWEE